MWSLTTPWWELVLRSGLAYLFLLTCFRILGTKHIGELAPYDLILLLIVSESMQSALTAGDESLLAAFICAGTLLVMSASINRITFLSHTAERLVEGEPKLLIRNGKINESMLKQEKITEQELHEALREEGVMASEDVRYAFLETDGNISVIRKKR